ncbi:MAG: FtsX-like permease family protein [Arcobacter sp.]|nr:FtsX-like permease family protein [Arcobacter sp.]
MFFRIILKGLIVKLNKTLIIFFSIALGASIITAFSSIYFDINTKMSKELRTFGANFFVGSINPQKYNYIAYGKYTKILDKINKDELVGATGYLYGAVRLDLGNAILAGINFQEAKKMYPFWQVEGSWINVDFDDKNCMVGKSLAKQMELKVGSFVSVKNTKTGYIKRLRVKGIIESGQAEDGQIFVNLPLSWKILDVKDKINYAMLSLHKNSLQMDILADKLNKEFKNLSAKPIRKVSHSEGKILNKIKGLMAIIAVMILIITTLCVNATLIATVRERASEIGLEKALGATNLDIIKQFLTQISLVAILGIIIGIIGGFVLAQIMGEAIFGSGIDMRVQVLPLTVIISYVASVIAALLPMKKLLSILPAQVLRGE